MLATLRQRNFGLLWLGGLISMLGDWALFTVLPFYIYERTGSTLAAGAMLIAYVAPGLLFGSIAGVLVDRWNRKYTMLLANLLRAPLLLLLLAVRSPDWFWLVYLIAFAASTISQFFMPAENALLPRLVGQERLMAANSLNALNDNLARLIGPAIGGALMALSGLGSVIILDAATYVLGGLLIALIAAPSTASASRTASVSVAAAWSAIWRELCDGLRLVRRTRPVGALFTVTGVAILADGIMSALLVVYVRDMLGGGAAVLGWLMTARGVGGLLGGFLLGYAGNRLLTSRLLPLCLTMFGVLLLITFNVALAPLVLALVALVGIAAAGWQISIQVLLQASVADRYRGRIFGAYGTLNALLGLVGMGIASTLGDQIGALPLLNASAILDLVAAALAFGLLGGAAPALARKPAPVVSDNV
jgi:MFS family permease